MDVAKFCRFLSVFEMTIFLFLPMYSYLNEFTNWCTRLRSGCLRALRLVTQLVLLQGKGGLEATDTDADSEAACKSNIRLPGNIPALAGNRQGYFRKVNIGGVRFHARRLLAKAKNSCQKFRVLLRFYPQVISRLPPRGIDRKKARW